MLSFFTDIPSLGRSTRPDYSRVSIFIQSVVETVAMPDPVALVRSIARLPSVLVRPVRLAEAEHVFQTLAGIFLIELETIIGGARIPAVTAEGVVLAGYAQLIHRAIHRIQRFWTTIVWGAIALRKSHRRTCRKEKDEYDEHVQCGHYT